MFNILKKWFSTPPIRIDFTDPVLGAMRFNADLELWEVSLPLDGSRAINICVAGKPEPDPRLLEHARDVAHDVPGFEAMIQIFLAAEAPKFRQEAPIVLALSIESLNIFWPERPDDGMIYFDGSPDDSRVWRCDYAGRRPQTLGYDG